MSTSMRDQLLKAGLINKKQANQVERQQQRQERRPAPIQPQVANSKVTRDQALNREQQARAEKKARLAQIKQVIEQHKLPAVAGDESYNFVDGGKVRRIAVDASLRDRLSRGEIAIVHHAARYELVPAAIAARIRERDEHAVVVAIAAKESAPADASYQEFSVPDDLIW